jgi:predicted dehydrogenase
MPTLKAAVIGYGYAGQTFHAPLLAHTPGLELAAIVSSRAEAVRAAWPQVRVHADTAALYAAGDVDLVVIATPNDTHYALAREALLAGRHVVVDKPFTATLPQARQLLELARERSLVLSAFQNRRWDADFLTLRALLDSGELGRVAHFESHFDRFRPQVRQRWREQPGIASGIWYDLGPHLADQVLLLFGRPQAVFADLAALRDGAGAVDHFHVLLRYADKRVILHGSMLVSGGMPRLAVHGTRASYIKYGLDTQETVLKGGGLPGCPGWGEDPLPGVLIRQQNGEEVRSDWPMQAGDYRRYYQAVRAAIVDGASNPVSAQSAIDTMTLIELAQASSDAGRELDWPMD